MPDKGKPPTAIEQFLAGETRWVPTAKDLEAWRKERWAKSAHALQREMPTDEFFEAVLWKLDRDPAFAAQLDRALRMRKRYSPRVQLTVCTCVEFLRMHHGGRGDGALTFKPRRAGKNKSDDVPDRAAGAFAAAVKTLRLQYPGDEPEWRWLRRVTAANTVRDIWYRSNPRRAAARGRPRAPK